MDDKAVITGTYSDLKIIKTRKVVQVIIECPIEQFEHIVKVVGGPRSDQEIPVCIARMDYGNSVV